MKVRFLPRILQWITSRAFGAATLLAILFVGVAPESRAMLISFSRLTSNSLTDYADSLSVELLDFGGQGLILVTMEDAPPVGFINQIYVEDVIGVFSDISFESTYSSGDVAYSAPATPGGPPGTSNLFLTSFSFDGDQPAPTNGVNNGETVAFVGTYAPGMGFGNAEQAAIDGQFRFAVHMQGIDPDGEESDTYLSTPPLDPRIPEPSTLVIMLVSVGVIGLRRRRRASSV